MNVKEMDYEKIKNVTLFLRVQNEDTREEARQTLVIHVIDVDEPAVFEKSLYKIHVNLTSDAPPGYHLFTVTARDPEGQPVNYSYPCSGVTNTFGNITVDMRSGEVVVAPGHVLKAESHNYTFCIQANDTSKRGTGTTGVMLSVYERHQLNIDSKAEDTENISPGLVVGIVIAIVIVIGVIIVCVLLFLSRQKHMKAHLFLRTCCRSFKKTDTDIDHTESAEPLSNHLRPPEETNPNFHPNISVELLGVEVRQLNPSDETNTTALIDSAKPSTQLDSSYLASGQQRY